MRVALDLLKVWQAYRPYPAKRIIRKLEKILPKLILGFQEKAKGLHSIREIEQIGKQRRVQLLQHMLMAVEAISAKKHSDTPMLGSKVMHFFFPEFFPVWDRQWIWKGALSKQGEFELTQGFDGMFLSPCALEYARYLSMMMAEIPQIRKQYGKLTTECIRYSKIDPNVIDWHFADLTPLIFELCLIGKHL